MLTGCGSFVPRLAPERMKSTTVPPGHGMILLSTGTTSPCTVNPIYLKMHPEGTPYHFKTDIEFNLSSSLTKSDFADHPGSVFAVIVPAGAYYVSPFSVSGYFPMAKAPKASFTVAAGETAYVGEYFLMTSCGAEGLQQIRDQMDRDLALVHAKNPRIDISGVTKRLMVIDGDAL